MSINIAVKDSLTGNDVSYTGSGTLANVIDYSKKQQSSPMYNISVTTGNVVILYINVDFPLQFVFNICYDLNGGNTSWAAYRDISTIDADNNIVPIDNVNQVLEQNSQLVYVINAKIKGIRFKLPFLYNLKMYYCLPYAFDGSQRCRCETDGIGTRFADFADGSLLSPRQYCNSLGQVKNLALVSPDSPLASKSQVCVGALSPYVIALLGTNSNGILNYVRYSLMAAISDLEVTINDYGTCIEFKPSGFKIQMGTISANSSSITFPKNFTNQDYYLVANNQCAYGGDGVTYQWYNPLLNVCSVRMRWGNGQSYNYWEASTTNLVKYVVFGF